MISDKRIEKNSFKVNQANNVLEGFIRLKYWYYWNNLNLWYGGGACTKAVLKYLDKNHLKKLYCYIPILGGENHFKPKTDYGEIKKLDENSRIIIVLNRVTSLNKDDIKAEFLNVFGMKILVKITILKHWLWRYVTYP